MVPKTSPYREQKFFADTKGIVVAHEPEVRVESREYLMSLLCIVEEFWIHFHGGIYFLNHAEKICLGLASNIDRIRHDIRSEKSEPLGIVLQVNFLGVELQVETFAEKISNLPHRPSQPLGILVYEDEIVHVPSIISKSQCFLDKHIEIVEVEVCEYLTREVANGQSRAGLREKETFGFGKTNPVGPTPLDGTIFGRIISDNQITQPIELFTVGMRIFCIQYPAYLRQ